MRNPGRDDPETYAAAVVDALVADFPDLTDPVVADMVRTKIARHRRSPSSALEVIVDSPHVANWRLKANLDDVRAVRLADCSFHSSDQRAARVARLNAVLAALG